MAPLRHRCKAPNKADSDLFSNKHRRFAPIVLLLEVFRCHLASNGTVAANPRMYILLCMFNGFAFARPFCGAIKGRSDGG